MNAVDYALEDFVHDMESLLQDQPDQTKIFDVGSAWLKRLISNPNSIPEAYRLPGRSVRTVMECSGSDATFFEYFKGQGPSPSRIQECMILSASEWTGVPLAAVLHEAGLIAKSLHVRAEGNDIMIRGYAWSGAGAIDQVDVSVDGGETWHSSQATDEVGQVQSREPRDNNMCKNFSAIVGYQVTVV